MAPPGRVGNGHEWRPVRSSNCWWYASAFQKVPIGVICVVILVLNGTFFSERDLRAAMACSAENVKIALQY
jgi:hypothetical protein